MYGKRYGSVSSGVTRAMRQDATRAITPIASYTLSLRDGSTLCGVAFAGRHALECESLRRYVNGLTEAAYQAATIVMCGRTIRLADITKLTSDQGGQHV